MLGAFVSCAVRVNISSTEYVHLSPASKMRPSHLSVDAYSFVLGVCEHVCVFVFVWLLTVRILMACH